MVQKILTLFFAAATVVACSTNKITGRSQLHLLPESELQSMGSQQYQQFLSENKVVSASADRDAEMVRRVGSRLANAVEKYFASKGLQKQLEGYKWEYNLVANNEANAWCMPGGKIVVYTGLLPYTRNEAALAIVLGHEITHAVFQHGNSRMSQGLLQQLGGVALSVALSQRPAETQNLFLQSYGVGSTLGVLAFSRSDESEADHYGLIWAALAGYNPQEAIPFWERMAQAGGSKPPALLSDHPADDKRIADIKKWMPEAMQYYKPVGSR
ncbi:M48 family metallopeptidase [Flavisolibacter ginsenosidimutans]|uniref:M48 family metallopeptidase n=1 Tax=Flavisolibacter ginsenosidimutans TaxID=661481 RepID=A0A5B8UES6_9BACT|nr:M48 family metallopeptidase [Flavisolibacter ginsenosidimutans]QEC54983.1 M48 family metallopeptidase [Flavisolibacter ginsenosidimutans]